MKNKKNNYSWEPLVIVLILMIIGFWILYATKITSISSYNEIYDYLQKYGVGAIVGIFFIVIGIYCWVYFIRNNLGRTRKEKMYLFEIANDKCCFLDDTGKKFYFHYDRKYQVKKYYEVLKTRDSIVEVMNIISSSNQGPKPKDSYWKNCYLPI